MAIAISRKPTRPQPIEGEAATVRPVYERYAVDHLSIGAIRHHVQAMCDVYGPRPIATGWLDQDDGHNC